MATAYAALVSLQNNLTLILTHPRHSFSFENKQIKSLLGYVNILIALMRCYDKVDGTLKKAAEAFERRITRSTHAAEDVIESHVVDQIRAVSTLSGKTTSRSRYLLDLEKVIHGMYCIITKIGIVIEKAPDAEQPIFPATISSIPLAPEMNKMVGFDDQLRGLMDMLTGETSSRLLIPIEGMGGIGKTTLATNAFEHPFIVHHFDVCLWATVSPEFSVHKILAELFSQIKEKTHFLIDKSSSVSSVDELGEGIRKNLFGRRYLIVLDDMWSVEAWEEMKFFFPDKSNGSRIVVTTRQIDVARHLGSVHIRVRFLDEARSWNLFCEKTFGDKGCPPELEDVGKRIVKNCGGLPLSIVVVGGRLKNSSRTTIHWENVANEMNSVLDSGVNEQCLNILFLSYRYLPVHLKPCFLFLGVFPKDQEISMWELIHLWIGEGFIEQYEISRLENVAMEYITELMVRNLVGVAYRSGVDRNWKFRVHDVLRELCLKIAVKDEFLSVVTTRRAMKRERRVVMKGKIHHAPRSASIVRSLVCEGGQLPLELKLLRVAHTVDSALVNEINLQHVNLRYVKIDVGSTISFLHSSISMLWNLQSLIITGAYGSVIAPYEIWEMLQLRRIEVYSIYLVDPLPVHQENEVVLKNLRILSRVENLSLSDEVCRRIPDIRDLEVSYVGEPLSNYYCLHNLGYFEDLMSLKCYFDGNANWRDLASNLTFPESLIQLNLEGCGLDWEDVTEKVGSLPCLEILVLDRGSVSVSEWTPIQGGFPSLKFLFIHHCDLIHWEADNIHFPVLENVYLSRLFELEEFPSGLGEIPTLVKIGMADCSVSSSLSAMTMMVEQEEMGNEELHLVVSFVEILEKHVKRSLQEEGLSLTRKNIHLRFHSL